MRINRVTVFLASGILIFTLTGQTMAQYRAVAEKDVVDLSVPLASDFPCTWPGGMGPYLSVPYIRIGPGPEASDLIMIDEHTGTQWDAPSHFIPPPETGLPNAAPYGNITSDKVPVWQFVGEACVIEISDLLDKADPGSSPLITKEIVQAWEEKNRQVGPGDVVIFRSGYTDKYYKKFPEGKRLAAEPLAGTAPAWPAPTPDCVEYLTSKGVMTLGIDSPSMGPLPDLAADTHIAGGSEGMIWAEMLANLGGLPNTGSFFALLGPKHADGSGGEARAIAVTDQTLAANLIKAAKQQRVVDLSVLLRNDLPVSWPGVGVGNYSAPYLAKTIHTWDQFGGPYFARTHILDAHTGTHVDPPAHFLPAPGFDNNSYSDSVKETLADYVKKYGQRKTTTLTTEKIPLQNLMGPARVIDVTHLVATTDPKSWPSSPMIQVRDIEEHEKIYGPIQRGEVVLFRSGHNDKYFLPLPYGERCVADPLNGKAEGWPSPSVETILYLAKKGVKCIGADSPNMGSANPKDAIQTHWGAAGEDVCFVEFLVNLGALPAKGAFFIFQPLKQVGGHGGIGRAIAVLP